MDDKKTILLTRIEELRVQLEEIKREREALYYDMQLVSIEGVCHACLHNPPEGKTCERSKRMKECFIWRGPCQANGGKPMTEQQTVAKRSLASNNPELAKG